MLVEISQLSQEEKADIFISTLAYKEIFTIKKTTFVVQACDERKVRMRIEKRDAIGATRVHGLTIYKTPEGNRGNKMFALFIRQIETQVNEDIRKKILNPAHTPSQVFLKIKARVEQKFLAPC